MNIFALTTAEIQNLANEAIRSMIEVEEDLAADGDITPDFDENYIRERAAYFVRDTLQEITADLVEKIYNTEFKIRREVDFG